jgi:hypothetical protein
LGLSGIPTDEIDDDGEIEIILGRGWDFSKNYRSNAAGQDGTLRR